jgi:hypothetical protein
VSVSVSASMLLFVSFVSSFVCSEEQLTHPGISPEKVSLSLVINPSQSRRSSEDMERVDQLRRLGRSMLDETRRAILAGGDRQAGVELVWLI